MQVSAGTQVFPGGTRLAKGAAAFLTNLHTDGVPEVIYSVSYSPQGTGEERNENEKINLSINLESCNS